jgi:hypothetical protein
VLRLEDLLPTDDITRSLIEPSESSRRFSLNPQDVLSVFDDTLKEQLEIKRLELEVKRLEFMVQGGTQ